MEMREDTVVFGEEVNDHYMRAWGEPGNLLHWRVVHDGILYTTGNAWGTYTVRGKLQIPGYADDSALVKGMAYHVSPTDTDRIVYFVTEPTDVYGHTIFVAYGESDITPEPKSGNDPLTPDGSSIPRSGEGCTQGGPKLFLSTEITLPS